MLRIDDIHGFAVIEFEGSNSTPATKREAHSHSGYVLLFPQSDLPSVTDERSSLGLREENS